MSRPHLAAAVFLCLVAAGPARGQDAAVESNQSAPANLAFVDGGVDLVHDGLVERAEPPMMLLEGDIIRTRSGRAEIVFPDGSLLHVDYDAELEILGAERIRLIRGRTLLRVSLAADRPYVFDTPAASVRFDSSGEYGISASLRGDDVEVTVARGNAEIDDGTTQTTVRTGELVWLASPGARPVFQSFNTARQDAFVQWSSARMRQFSSAASASQLPSELRPYGEVLDQYGSWQYAAPYGYVWYPAVGVAWRPYYDGYWRHTIYGWTWQAKDRWAWPTHHYGRWGYNGGFWFWIPSKVWGPAWVSWGAAPGYVGWCPLGWDNRPVYGNAGYIAGNPYNPWRSWTVIPRHSFGYGRSVRQYAVDGSALAEPVRTALLSPATPLSAPLGTAIPRASIQGGRGDSRRADGSAQRRGDARRPQVSSTPSGTPTHQPGVIDLTSREPRAQPRSGEQARPAPRTAPDPRDGTPEPRAVYPRGARAEPEGATEGRRDGDSGRRDGGGAERPGSVREARPRGQPTAEQPATGGAARGGDEGARQGGSAQRGGARAPVSTTAPAARGGAISRRP
jgi:uncharacterized protein DUF6600/FecR-like protein